MAESDRRQWRAVLGRPEPCLHHAQRYLDLCEENGIADWDLGFAYEALARRHGVAVWASHGTLQSVMRERFDSVRVHVCSSHASFAIGDVVRHRMFAFRGVIFDVDPVFANSEEWYESIPEDARPRRDQPFYHLLAENAEASYIAYVSQQNLERDEDAEPVDHPAIPGLFGPLTDGRYPLRREHRH